MPRVFKDGHPYFGFGGKASNASYDNAESGLEATDVQAAIDELAENGGGIADIDSATPTFTEASSRENIASGESISTLFGKIKKFFADLKTVAFTGSYNDLSDKPSSANVACKIGRSGDPSYPMVFLWAGQAGQPTWLWGGNDGTNMYVYNPSNFSVSSAQTLTSPYGNISWGSHPQCVVAFNNGHGFVIVGGDQRTYWY